MLHWYGYGPASHKIKRGKTAICVLRVVLYPFSNLAVLWGKQGKTEDDSFNWWWAAEEGEAKTAPSCLVLYNGQITPGLHLNGSDNVGIYNTKYISPVWGGSSDLASQRPFSKSLNQAQICSLGPGPEEHFSFFLYRFHQNPGLPPNIVLELARPHTVLTQLNH